MPCVIIEAFQIEYTRSIRDGLLLAVFAAVIIHVVLLILTRICGKIFKLSPVERLSAMYSNAGNLIIPIVSSILGSEWIIYSSAFIVVQLVLIWTHGRVVMSGKKEIRWKEFLININMISILIGMLLFFFNINLPTIVGETILGVSKMIGPICMLTAGILFAGVDIRKMVKQKRIYLVTVLRMVVFPFVVLIVLKVSHLSQLVEDGTTILLISFLATTTPTAATVTQMAQVYGGDIDNATGIYVVTTLIAIITMPIFVMLFQL